MWLLYIGCAGFCIQLFVIGYHSIIKLINTLDDDYSIVRPISKVYIEFIEGTPMPIKYIVY